MSVCFVSGPDILCQHCLRSHAATSTSHPFLGQTYQGCSNIFPTASSCTPYCGNVYETVRVYFILLGEEALVTVKETSRYFHTSFFSVMIISLFIVILKTLIHLSRLFPWLLLLHSGSLVLLKPIPVVNGQRQGYSLHSKGLKLKNKVKYLFTFWIKPMSENHEWRTLTVYTCFRMYGSLK